MTNLGIIFASKSNQVHNVWIWSKNNPIFLTFVVFASFIFVKLFYFHFSIEHPTCPQSISLFILPKLAISLLISSFILITKNKWWTIPVSLLVDIWIVGNIIYYYASGFFINTEALQMIDNMRGFWDSIFIYFSWGMPIPFLLTLLYSIFIIKSHLIQSTRHKSLFILIILFSFSMRIFVNCFQHSVVIKDYWVRNEKNNIESIWKIIRPVVDSHFEAYDAARRYFNHGIFTDWEKQYVIQNTILDFFFANVSYYISKKYYKNKTIELKQYVELVPSDKEIINDLITIDSSLFAPPPPQTNLVVILFESLEGWVFEDFDGAEHVAPNMKKLIGMEHTLFAPRIKSQAKQGNSGDGQMIVLTGILPLKAGAACRLYGNNSYPNYAHFFNNSTTINPSPGSWNQGEVNPNYGIKYLVEFHGNDNQMIDSLIEYGNNAERQFFLLGITTASHSPFNCENIFNKPILSSDMPNTLQNYLTCVNYTDNALGKLISLIETNSKWANTTLVIVGDHTVFKEQMLDKFFNYAQKANISLKVRRNYIPLIIYSPQITSKTIKKDIHYQSDIYPTILNLIGAKDYYWRGVGQDILSEDGSSRLDEETGYKISDIIIRNNYFEKYTKFNKPAIK